MDGINTLGNNESGPYRLYLVMEGGLVILEVDGEERRQIEPTLIEQEQADAILRHALRTANRIIEAVNTGKMVLGQSKVADGVLYVRSKRHSGSMWYLRLAPQEGDAVLVKEAGDPARSRYEENAPSLVGLQELRGISAQMEQWLAEDGL